MTQETFSGRILFLSVDPAIMRRQLAGETLTLAEAGDLRDEISTDEITPVRVLTVYDERLGSFPYVGVKSGDAFPIQADDIRRGGFEVVVAGIRYGKGSSREHSPLAERHAGIRLVIARSFERIYRQNADNIGLYTSTDFGLLERIHRGKPIPLEEFVASRDDVTAQILRHRGLLRYGTRFMRNLETVAGKKTVFDRPMTLTEKILMRHRVSVDGGPEQPKMGDGIFVRPDWRFIHEYYTGLCHHTIAEAVGHHVTLDEPQSIVAFEDHLSYAHQSKLHVEGGLLPNVHGMLAAHRAFVVRHGIRNHGFLPEGEGSEGISHAIMAERYAMPGQLVVGTDSHTTHSGCVGALAFGVGTSDMANAMLTGAVRLTMPESLQIKLHGPIPDGVTAKDIVLQLLADPRIKAGLGVGKVFEFTGSAIAMLNTDERATLTNMTAELGGLTGIVAPDSETVHFLAERRGVTCAIPSWMTSDPEARYYDYLEVDCQRLGPMVSRPGDPSNAIPLIELAERPRIDIAYGGSCTAGKREDFDLYHAVLSWACERALRVPPGVQLFLQFGTIDVRNYCLRKNYLETFERAGATLLQPSCGACANCGPGSSTDASQTTISAINRNFPGRSGPGQVWLASPATVAASAVAGEIVSFEELKRRFG